MILQPGLSPAATRRSGRLRISRPPSPGSINRAGAGPTCPGDWSRCALRSAPPCWRLSRNQPTTRTDATIGVPMRERPWDDLGGGPAGSTPRGRRKAPAGRRPVVSYHPGASRRASRRLTRRADMAVTVAGAFSFPRRWRRTPRSCRARSASRMPHRNSTRARRPRCSSVPACSSWPPSSPPWWLAESGAGPRRLPIVAPSTAARWSRRPGPDGFPAPPRRRRPELRSSSPNRRRLPRAGTARPPGPRERRARAVRRVGRRGTRADSRGCARPLVVE